MTTTRAIVAMFAAAALFVPTPAMAQTALADTFEVSSVKVNTHVDGPRGVLVDQGRFTATGQLLSDLVRYAYGFSSLASQTQVVGGPAWMSTTRFDIVATTTKGLPSLTMLKALLQDRFKIVAHVESRAMPVYALLVDRGDKRLGAAIHVSTSDCVGPGGTAPPTTAAVNRLCAVRGRPGSYTGEGASMAQLARALGGFPAVGRPVVDRTALNGVYDWTLQWTPTVNAAPADGAAAVATPDASAGASLFTALREQLGLKLDAQRLPIDVACDRQCRTSCARLILGEIKSMRTADAAIITLQRIAVVGGDCCVGNAGEDLLKQAGFTIDLSTMTLQLSSAKH